MSGRFIRYSLIAAALTYTAVFVSVNYSSQIETSMNMNKKSTKTNVSVLNAVSDVKSPSLVTEGAFFTPCLNSNGNKLLYSSGDNIYEMDMLTKDIKQLTYMGNCYNPVYYQKDNNIIAFARNNGIYIMDAAKNIIRKIVSSDNPQVSYAKPNFTLEGDIIYFKVTVIPNPEGHGFIEQNPGIYKINKDGRFDEKLFDGYNPVLFKDGKKLCYELKDNIYVMDLETRDNKLIDAGKYATWSNSGKYISYSKFERSKYPYTKINKTKKLFIDKEYSNIYIAPVNNPKNKIKITKEVFEDREKEIENWANDIKHTTAEQHFLVASQQAYFDSVWSMDDESILVSLYNSNKGGFELSKYNIKIK